MSEPPKKLYGYIRDGRFWLNNPMDKPIDDEDIEYLIAAPVREYVERLENAGDKLSKIVVWAIHENIVGYGEDGEKAVRNWQAALEADHD